MKLISITSEPIGLFAHTKDGDGVVRFTNGVNFVFGRKDKDSDAKESLNGIGKSLFLDFIDFCLLSAFDKRNVRLYEAKEKISDYTLVLKFEIDEVHYTIKRSFANPDEVQFGSGEQLQTYTNLRVLGRELADTIFTREYTGSFSNDNLRTLIPFFLKIHKVKQSRFTDPVRYQSFKSLAELIPIHLYFIGIDNTLSQKNADYLKRAKELEPALREIKKFTEQKYEIDITDADSEIEGLQREVQKVQEDVEVFKLADSYEDAEADANKLTVEIKQLVAQDFADRQKISLYEESYRVRDDSHLAQNVGTIYSELQEDLGIAVNRTLEEAVTFRKALSDSRKEFLQEEISILRTNINERKIKVDELEKQRGKIYSFLQAQNAIQDLTHAFKVIDEKNQKISDLRGKVKLFKDFRKEKADINSDRASLEPMMLAALEQAEDNIARFRAIFSEVYNSAYPESASKSHFTIALDSKKDAKVVINIKVPAMRSEGKNQGRSLIYDLSVLVNGIREQLHLPRFMAHDGIFDGVDKAHFVGVCNFVNELSRAGEAIQYIVPLNEEGTLSEQFGEVDELTPEEIEKQAILVLTPSKKLTGQNWG